MFVAKNICYHFECHRHNGKKKVRKTGYTVTKANTVLSIYSFELTNKNVATSFIVR